MRETIKVTHAALDDVDGQIVLRGVLDPSSFALVQSDDYQREALPLSSLGSLITALQDPTNQVPDIVLGSRGGSFIERDGAFYLQDPTYVVDGLQRLTAAMFLIRTGKKLDPHIGCSVKFNTTKQSECKLFKILNTSRLRLSASVLIRNYREENPCIEMLWQLTKDPTFSMYDRISWNQKMQRTELMSAFTYAKLVGSLHSSFGPGRSHQIDDIAKAMTKIMQKVGRAAMRKNVKTFFDVFDSAWGIKRVVYGENAPYLKGTFMMTVALVLAHHKNFWEGFDLVVESSLRKKLSLFPINDPVIQSLAGAHGMARAQLYNLLVQHINSGKRTRRLVPFKDTDPMSMVESQEEQEEVEEVEAS
jgi:hypothetical protein